MQFGNADATPADDLGQVETFGFNGSTRNASAPPSTGDTITIVASPIARAFQTVRAAALPF